MTDVRYIGRCGPPRTITRATGDTALPIPAIAWAGDGTFGWGAPGPEAIDTAVAMLHAETGDVALACTHAPQVAAVLTGVDPAGFEFTATALRRLAGLVAPVAPDLRAAHDPGHLEDEEIPDLVFTVSAVPLADALALWSRIGRTAEDIDIDLELLDEPLTATMAHAVCQRLGVSPHDLWAPEEATLVEQLALAGTRS